MAEPLDPKSRVGRVLRERWRVDELVWTTPASSLYWATHRTGTRAAIRVLAPELSASEARAGHFLETGGIVQRIGHDGAVRILDDDRDQDGCVFLVLELFDAVSLRAILDNAHEPMVLEEAARLGVGMLEVLAAAHKEDILHGALRAEDVFVTRQGLVKLLGFEGRALDPSGGPTFQRDTSAVGTLLYTMLTSEPPRGHSLAIARPDLPRWMTELVDRALGFGSSPPWADAGAMLAAMLTTYRPPTPHEAFEAPGPSALAAGASRAPEGSTGHASSSSFVAFPVTDDMNPLFVQTGESFRPLKRPGSATIARRAATSLEENRLHRQRRNRMAVGLAILVVGILAVVTAFIMRQM